MDRVDDRSTEKVPRQKQRPSRCDPACNRTTVGHERLQPVPASAGRIRRRLCRARRERRRGDRDDGNDEKRRPHGHAAPREPSVLRFVPGGGTAAANELPRQHRWTVNEIREVTKSSEAYAVDERRNAVDATTDQTME